ncbi:MAG: hypothetical protein F7C35_07475 [Desulfurococcales archaeon]|nr:hypothetical protein [Desulfurococcales archaeon]
MAGECKGYKKYLAGSTIWAVLALASGVLGYKIINGDSALVGATSLILGLAGGSYIAYNTLRNLARARVLEAYCKCPVYCPRRYSFLCKRDSSILCYNYVTGYYYLIREEERLEERRVTPLTPLDYYCVKYLGGRLEERGEARVYSGLAEYLVPRDCGVARGRATIIVGGDPSVLSGARNEQ